MRLNSESFKEVIFIISAICLLIIVMYVVMNTFILDAILIAIQIYIYIVNYTIIFIENNSNINNNKP